MQQITRGDYLKDLITIFIENNLQQDITDLYSQFIFQCGAIQKTFTPAQVIKISFNEQESLQLKNINVCYLAGITSDGHKETFNGSLAFNTRGEVVMYEPANISAANVTTSDAPQCSCQGLNAVYSNCCQPAIKAYFSLNYVPTKLSELQNDTDFQDSVDVADAVSEHNESEQAHSYIQGLITDAQTDLNGKIGELDNLTTTVKTDLVSAINSEVSARGNADTTLANDYNTKIGTLSNLDTSVKTNIVSAINSVISDEAAIVGDLTDLETSSSTNIVSAINSVLSDEATIIGDLDDLGTSVKTSIVSAINSEVSDRQSADNGLQTQIDAIAAASDVTDIVGTYAELQAYDTQHLNNNDIIKVLTDSTHNNAPSYYRYNKSTDSFTYIGSESASYTKAESDALFVPQTRTVNSKALSSDITLTSSDVGALASTTTINDLTTTAQQNALNSGATSAKINQIATNTGNITTNANAISTINGKIPADASSSNKLVTASALSNAVVNLANQDLSNLTETGNDRLHALKGYEDAGELLTDAEGLAFVKNYAHSTFDSSKFTVVGSPVITNDGIASGFSGSNYLTTIYSGTTKDFEVLIPFTVETLDATHNILGQMLFLYANGRFVSDIGDGSKYGGVYATVNTNYLAKIKLKNGYHSLNISTDNGANWVEVFNVANTNTYTFNNITIGCYNNYNYFKGSIDLKKISFTVEGVEVFSGNRTGIDTIKPDDYTVVGTPTISADGVASGFSSSNYLNTGYLLDTVKQWTIYTGKIRFNDISTLQTILCSSYKNDASSDNNPVQLALNTQGKLRLLLSSTNNYGNNSPDIANSVVGNATFLTNTDYYFKLEFDGNKYVLSYSTDGENYTVDITINSSTTVASGYIVIGLRLFVAVTGNPLLGSIDLNAFKIYIDGNLVYQPCLKIPYTESKTGSKVVDSVYRSRVNDMAQQFGYAPYYILQEDKVPNYIVMGSPTISSDYIASGFSNSNYLKTTSITLGSGDFDIYAPVKFTSALSNYTNGRILTQDDKIRIMPYNGTLAVAIIATDNSNIISSNFVPTTNTEYLIHLYKTGTTYGAEYSSDNGSNWTNINQVTSDKQVYYYNTAKEFKLGNNIAGGDIELDLNAFKIYVDGNLVYQAVIPPNFTLPIGELYGLIGQRTLKDSYRNGISYWELWSDRTLEQGGTCTSGVEYTLLKPFSNTNYVLTIPYTSKTTTTFIPSATGDFIAKGTGTL